MDTRCHCEDPRPMVYGSFATTVYVCQKCGGNLTALVERWHRTALQCFSHYPHGSSQLERMNCEACALVGYEPRGGWEEGHNVKREGPYVAGWAKIYIEAQVPIPKKWRAAFERELERTDNLEYVNALKQAISLFGVKFGG